MRIIDAKGYDCPMPVIMTNRVIKEGIDEILVKVDNEIATENLSKMAKETGFDVDIVKLGDDDYEVKLIRNKENVSNSVNSDDYIVVIDSNKMGTGDEEFSKTLLKGFLLALTEQERYPKYIIFYNEGTRLTTEDIDTIEDIKKLEDSGVEVLSCGLCLDHYNLKDKLAVGQVTNMYRICQLMTEYTVVRP